MKIFVKIKPLKSTIDDMALTIRTIVLAEKGNEMEALNCNNIWIEVEEKDGEYFPVGTRLRELYIPKDQIEDKMIIL